MSEQLHILVVEDNEADVHILQMALSESGLPPYVKEVVNNGDTALQRLKTGAAPDLAILDLNLPGADGHELIQLFASTEHLRDTPVVILSSSKTPRDVQSSKALQSCLYVTKPFDLDEFIAIGPKIREFWESNRNQPHQSDGHELESD